MLSEIQIDDWARKIKSTQKNVDETIGSLLKGLTSFAEECTQRQGQLNEAISILRELEWGYWDGEYYWEYRCPFCHRNQYRDGTGHADDCKLAKLLERVKE